MEAKFTKQQQNGWNYGIKKELVSTWNVIVNDNGKLINLITVRCYMGRSSSASVVYATVWVHGDHYTSGTGKAAGYGYHKQSAAIGDAIENAGIEMSESINARGDSAITEALEAIARAMGFESCLIVQN